MNKDIKKCLECKAVCDSTSSFTLICNHSICSKCLCKYLENFTTAKIHCPIRNCSQLIPDNIIRKCLSNEEIERYDDCCYFSGVIKCLIKECRYFIGAVEKQGHYVCPNCEQPNCVTCSNLHLENEPCGISSKKSQYEETAFSILIKKRGEYLLNLTKNADMIENPEKSECQCCNLFLLPREGYLISSCMHNFCRNCLETSAKSADIIAKLGCLKCDALLLHRESTSLIGESMLEGLSLNAVKKKFYQCSSPDCDSFWDSGDFKGFYKCTKCHKDNCIPCNDVHEGQTCKEYRQSRRYKTIQKHVEVMKKVGAIKCYNCNNEIVKKGGCGALTCNSCLKQVCAFYGTEIGPQGCKCQQTKRCHKKCETGCIPEGKSKYEKDLYNYFFEK